MNLLMSSSFEAMTISWMIPTRLNLLVPFLHTTGMIRILTCQYIFCTLLDIHHHLQSNQNMKMTNGALNIREQFKNFVPIIRNYNTTATLIFMVVSADHMDGSLRIFSHPLEGSIPMTVAVIPAMIGQKIPASHPTQAIKFYLPNIITNWSVTMLWHSLPISCRFLAMV